jgi:DNA invertase Pin-like site-specific DNA recombinase
MSDAVLKPTDLLETDCEPINNLYDNTKPMMLFQSETIATYLRVSTDEQEIRTQQGAVERLLLTYGINYEDVQHFEDEGVSATKMTDLVSRPNARQLVEMVETGTINKIFIYRVDRIFRDNEAGAAFVKWCKKFGVELHSTDLSLPLTTAEGEFQFALQVALARREAAVLSERTQGGMQRTMEDLKPVSKIAPYGWDYWVDDRTNEKTARPNWHEQGVINWVHEQTESNKKVADKLNARGVPAKQGGKWSAASLWRMQNQPAKYQSQLDRFKQPKRMIQYPFRALQVSVL